MDDAYYRWLIDLLDDEYLRLNYQKLLRQLFDTEYYWEINFDGNRASDGLNLRKYYGNQIGYPGFSLPQGCTVLEMMLALAKRTEDDIMHDPRIGDRTAYWFWTMRQNLDLDRFDDFSYNADSVDCRLQIFMHHRYAPDGNGGLFPCYGIETDMRKTDLWWQLNQFLVEKYY